MNTDLLKSAFLKMTHQNAMPFLRENKTIIIRFLFTLFFLAIGIWFIVHEHDELIQIKDALSHANIYWVITGIVLTILYIFSQGLMYVFSFKSVNCTVSLINSTILFIKRNLISIFLPAGGISSLAFFSGSIEKNGTKKSQIHFASTIYGFVGIASVVLVGIPAFIFAMVEGTLGSGDWIALLSIIIILILSVTLYKALKEKKQIYSWIVKLIPSTEFFLNNPDQNIINRKHFLNTILISVFIEFIGIAHLYVAMKALGLNPTLFAATMGYIISVIFLIISPFLRGLGAIEVSMAIVLVRFGMTGIEAISATFLYRFFEFWLPLMFGIITFLSKINKLLMRILPALLMMILGITNIISVLTPAITIRLVQLKNFIPIEMIHASNELVFISGLLLLLTAAFMIKGLKTAWYFALILTIISFIGHLTKAIDFEEATFAAIVGAVLVATRKEYYIKTNPKLRNVGLQTALILAGFTMIYGIVGFYFLDQKHFNINFSLIQSVKFTVLNYLMVGSVELNAADSFAKMFIHSLSISGFVSISFLVYTFVNTYRHTPLVGSEELQLANKILNESGNSALDYFKVYNDKLLYFNAGKNAFLAYRIAGNFAVVLENPVAPNLSVLSGCITEFDQYCLNNGLKSIYYRVPEKTLPIYKQLRKKEMFIGQEGVLYLDAFNLNGGSKKSIRNAIKKVTDRGFTAHIHRPPIKDGTIQKLKSVSDEWLQDTGRSEIIFSQGMFRWDEIKYQTILTVDSPEEKIVAFLNIIPDFSPGEATFDLIRKTKDAPNGIMDFMMIELINYLKRENYKLLNIGFAPMSGLNDPHSFTEKSMKFAYEKIRSFSHYKGLREYKEKFEPEWHNKYLIFQHDFDLVQIPSILTKVIKP